MKRPKTEEQVLNEVRIEHKKMRRAYWRLLEMGVILPGDSANKAFLQLDYELLDIEKMMVEIIFTTTQEPLFEEKEDGSYEPSSSSGVFDQ